MIEKSHVDEALNRIHSHFGKRMVVQPPADAAALHELEEMAGTLPRSYMIFLTTCNGLTIRFDDKCEDEHLPCIHEIESAKTDVMNPATVNRLIPIRGDVEGLCDWLCLEEGPAYGSVIRWNPWTDDARYVSSSFDRYLDAWSRYLVKAHDSDGRLTPFGRKASFDDAFIRRHDVKFDGMANQESTVEWLRELQMSAPTGEDME